MISGGFNCNKGQYYVTQSVYIMDADGNLQQFGQIHDPL